MSEFKETIEACQIKIEGKIFFVIYTREGDYAEVFDPTHKKIIKKFTDLKKELPPPRNEKKRSFGFGQYDYYAALAFFRAKLRRSARAFQELAAMGYKVAAPGTAEYYRTKDRLEGKVDFEEETEHGTSIQKPRKKLE